MDLPFNVSDTPYPYNTPQITPAEALILSYHEAYEEANNNLSLLQLTDSNNHTQTFCVPKLPKLIPPDDA